MLIVGGILLFRLISATSLSHFMESAYYTVQVPVSYISGIGSLTDHGKQQQLAEYHRPLVGSMPVALRIKTQRLAWHVFLTLLSKSTLAFRLFYIEQKTIEFEHRVIKHGPDSPISDCQISRATASCALLSAI